MSSTRRILLVGMLSLGLLLVLMLLVVIGNFFAAERPATISYREVALATPPPPPPPPQVASADATAAPVNLSLANPESPVLMSNMDLEVELPKGGLVASGLGWGKGEDAIGLGIDWSGFGLNELDGQPVVLTSPLFVFPADFAKRSVKQFQVRLEILIDETGRPYLMRVVQTPDVSINAALENFVRDVRFSPPMLSGVPVRATYVWPVTLTIP